MEGQTDGPPFLCPGKIGREICPWSLLASTGPQFYLCRELGIFSGVRNLEPYGISILNLETG